MALFKIFKGGAQDLGKDKSGTTTKTNTGYAYFTPDDGKFYIDITSDEQPVVGSSSLGGVNRICINDPFMDNLIFDCGFAAGWIEITQEYWDSGDSTELPEDVKIVLYDTGSSDNEEEYYVIYDGGSSY